MTEPERQTRDSDQYKRQLTILDFYLRGRIKQLERIANQQPNEADACGMARTELMLIVDQVLPQMREVQP